MAGERLFVHIGLSMARIVGHKRLNSSLPSAKMVSKAKLDCPSRTTCEMMIYCAATPTDIFQVVTLTFYDDFFIHMFFNILIFFSYFALFFNRISSSLNIAANSKSKLFHLFDFIIIILPEYRLLARRRRPTKIFSTFSRFTSNDL